MAADDGPKKTVGSLFSLGVVALSAAIVAALTFFSVYYVVVPEAPVQPPKWTTISLKDKLSLHSFDGQLSGYERLKALGFSPKAVLDLGASSGHWGALMKERFSASPFLVSFSSTARGNTSLATGFPTIVVDAASVKKRRNGIGTMVGAREVPFLSTIDELCNELPPASMLRISSAEDLIDILEGASKVIANAEVMVLELNLMDGHANKNTKPLVLLDYLNRKGFLLYDVLEYLKFFATEYSPLIDRATFLLLRKNSNLIPVLNKIAKLTA